MRVRLNGWQRGWCAGAAVALGVIALDTYRHLPTAAQVRSRAEAAAAAEAARWEDPCHDPAMTQFDRSMCELKAESGALPPAAASAAGIRQAAEIDIRERLPGRQFDAVWRGLVLWLAIVVGVYGAGWAVGRVVHTAAGSRSRS